VTSRIESARQWLYHRGLRGRFLRECGWQEPNEFGVLLKVRDFEYIGALIERMGTNFFYLEDEKKVHIGKRSSAGIYCWDCHCSVPADKPSLDHPRYICPNCKEEFMGEALVDSSAGRELGFNKGPFKVKTGIKSASRFSWATKEIPVDAKIVNEYGEEFTFDQFHEMLKECPMQNTEMIGKEFS